MQGKSSVGFKVVSWLNMLEFSLSHPQLKTLKWSRSYCLPVPTTCFKSHLLQNFKDLISNPADFRVHTSPRYTTEATTGLTIPTLNTLTSSTMYVNVYLRPSDSNMSDFMLLHTILSHIERCEHTWTLWPEMNGQDQCCFSFHIFGYDQLQIRANAIHLVNNWICCLGISRPPYFRAMIFPSERWAIRTMAVIAGERETKLQIEGFSRLCRSDCFSASRSTSLAVAFTFFRTRNDMVWKGWDRMGGIGFNFSILTWDMADCKICCTPGLPFSFAPLVNYSCTPSRSLAHH